VLTLTGPGGTGKTRLALEAAGRAIGAFPDGVVYVSLASLADPSLVASTIAAAVELPEMAGRSLIDRLTDHLGEKQLLLVLDNFEHLLEARTVVQQLVSQCAALSVLVTSRAALHLTAEHEYAVPSLSLPDLSHLPELEALSHYDAVALFIQRAQAVRADFALTDDSAPAVAEICSRLDGLPLAIELAAARTKLFPPKALLTRLQHRLRLLTGGAKDLPQRQQTLRATIDWSYSLLSPAEQALFARLSVFAGGCTFEAADSVCNARGDLDLLEGIASLVEQSLLRQVGTDEPRFVMLETTREYAAEKLSDSGHEAETAQRHARYFLAYAEEARADQDRSHTESALERLAAEIDNLRAAVRWSIDHGDVEMGLRIASAFVSTLPLVSWSYYTDEVWNWCQEIFTLDRRTVSPHLRASALLRAAVVAQFVGSAHQARLLVDEVISLLDEIEDKRDRAVLAGEAGWIMRELGDYAHATPLLEMALPLFRDLDDEWGVAQTLLSLGEVAREQGDAEATVTCCSESLRLYRELGDGVGSGWSLYDLGLAAWMTGDFEQATHLYKEAMRVIRAGDYEVGIPDALMALGLVLRDQDDLAEAERVLADALEYCEGTRAYLYPAPMALEAMAGVATATGEDDRAATLFGAASSLRERIGFAVWPVLRSRHETDLAAIEEALGAEQFSRAWDMGHAMTTEQAVAYARESSGRSGG
jgi:predicted ATPase